MIAGNYRERKINPDDIDVPDCYNPWNLFTLFNQENSVVTSWCMRNGFLHGETPCDRPGCSGHLKPAKRTKQIDGATLQCTKNRDHEMSIRKKQSSSGQSWPCKMLLCSRRRILMGAPCCNRKLSGQVEIDESLFGRKIKYNRGNRSKGLRIWVFGLVERDSNTILLYPVSDRKETTLLPLIQRHVA